MATYFDPKKNVGVKGEWENVTDYPRHKEFQSVKVRAAKVKTDDQTGQITIKGGELLV